MVAEALNVGDGRSLGRAVVDVPAPLDKPKINRYTHFMARKLMDGMILDLAAHGQRNAPTRRRPGPDKALQSPPLRPRAAPAPHTRATHARTATPLRKQHRPTPPPAPQQPAPAPSAVPRPCPIGAAQSRRSSPCPSPTPAATDGK